MTRDDDYLRTLLMEAEADDASMIYATEVLNPDPDDLKRRIHANLLTDAGFLQRVSASRYRLTNAGHDYPEAIRNEGV